MHMLAPHGDVIGYDADRPRDVDALAGFEMHVGTDGTELLDRVRTVVTSPGVPRQAPVVCRALAPALRCRRARAGLAPRRTSSSPSRARTARRPPPSSSARSTARRARGRGGRERGDAALSLWCRAEPAATIVAEASSFSSGRVEFAPEAALLINLADDTWTATALRGLSRREAEGVRTSAEHVAVAPPGLEVPGRGRRVPPDGRRVAGRHAEIRLRGAHNARTRRPPPRWRWPAGGRTRSARRCAPSPACRTGSRRSPSGTASPTSTTRRRPTSPRRPSGPRPSTAASTRSWAAASRGRLGSCRAGRPSLRAVYLIGETPARSSATWTEPFP